MRLSTHTKLFLSHFTAILLVSGSIGTYFYSSAIDSLMSSLKSRLKNSAALISQSIDATDLDTIRDADDMTSPGYVERVAHLRNYVRANPDIAFIYVMRKDANRIIFVLDSDPDEPAEPGDEYPHRIPELMEGFLRPSVDREITSDQWGHFLSGYSPLRSSKGEYLIGLDMRADEVHAKFQQIRIAGILSLIFSLLLAMVFSNLLSRHFTRRISALSDRCSVLGNISASNARKGAPGDELDQLGRTFDQMTERLETNRQQMNADQQALRKAHAEMEHRVEERTSALEDANRELRIQINERLRVEQILEASSRTDYLTKLLNRRAMVKRLEQETALQQRHGRNFCLIMLDLDHFKHINDNHGHDAGDQVLIEVADILRRGIRESDVLARWGGEEFFILLPQTQLKEARGLAERLRQQLERMQGAVTGSFGVVQFDGSLALTACIKKADQALYAAKHRGRNRVEVADAKTSDPD